MKKHSRLRAITAASMLVLAPSPAAALDVTWLGGEGLWSATNWSAGGAGPIAYPAGLVDLATIGAAGTAPSFVTLDRPAFASSLVIARPVDRLQVGSELGVVSLVNNGRLEITQGDVTVSNSTFAGSGVTTVQNDGSAFVTRGIVSGGQLTIAADHTLEAAGRLGNLQPFTTFGFLRGLDNQGTLVVTPRPGSTPDGLTLEIGNQGFFNHGRVVVPDGLFLSVQTSSALPGANLFNSAGTIELGSNSRVLLKDGNMYVSGRFAGPAVGSPPGVIETTNRLMLASQFSGEVLVRSAAGLPQYRVTGTVINDGHLMFDTATPLQAVLIDGRGGFAGTGTTDFTNFSGLLLGAGSNPILDIGAGHTLLINGAIGSADSVQGGGLFMQVNNRGQVATDPGTALGILAMTFDNRDGEVHIGDGGALSLGFSPRMQLQGSLPVFSGGSIRFETTGTLVVDRATLRDVVLVGNEISLRPGGTVNPGVGGFGSIGGLIQVGGTLRVDGPGLIADGDVNAFGLNVAAGGATLSGPGSTVFADGPRNAVMGDVLTIASGHTLRGGGSFGSFRDGLLLGFVNQGTVIVDAPNFGMRFEGVDYIGPPVRNEASLVVTAGSTLALTGTSFIQSRPQAILTVDGQIVQTQDGPPQAPSFVIAAGTLTGCGSIRAASVVVGTAVVQPTAGCPSFPRAAPARSAGQLVTVRGPLRIDGNLHLDPTSRLTLDLGAPGRDRSIPALDVSGVAEFAGLLDIQLGDPDSVAVGDTFQLFSFGSFSGAFSEVLVQGYGVNTFFNGNVLSVLVTSAVPEPAPWALLLAGASGWLLRRRRAAAN